MRRWLKRILILLAIFVVPPTAFFFYAEWQADRELRAALAKLDATETPWRWEDLIAARPKLAEHEDARTVMLNARLLASGFYGRFTVWEKAYDRPPHAAIISEDFEPLDELMKSVKPALAEGRKLAQMPGGRFHFAWSADPLAGNYDDVQKAREFVALMRSAAAWNAQHGDIDAAMDDCLAMQRACQSLGDEGTIIVHLVRIAMQAISIQALERVLAQGQPAPERLEELQRAWERFDRDRAMLQCLRGERAYTNRWFEALSSGNVATRDVSGAPKGKPVPFGERLEGFFLIANQKQAHAWFLRHWDELMLTMTSPEPERAARQGKLEMAPAHAPVLARMLMPAVLKVFEAHRRGETQIRCAIIGLAAERYRRRHERWPTSLAEMCPDFLAKVLDDPYSGQPLTLRPTGDGIVIYSVGPDGKQCGNCQEERAAGRVAISYEFRLWDFAHRRKLVARQP